MDLKDKTRLATERARASGTLAPIDTHVETLSDHGITYVVRVLRNLRRKHQAAGGSQPTDPFAPPYNHDLVVAELPPAHMVLLNKFPVLNPHLLAVTRENEPQTNLLTVADCQALLWLLHERNGLAFYNAGTEAGASQPHKHLQLIGLPLPSTGLAFPLTEALAADDNGDGISRSPQLPFPHARVRMPQTAWREPSAGAQAIYRLYLNLLETVGLAPDGLQQPGPYNLLATREWLWLVPRRRQSHEGLEVNSLAFAGTLLVPDEAHLTTLKTVGPAACLRAVCP